MVPTINIEFISDTEQHLRSLERQLKHIRDVEINLVEPKKHMAPALVTVAIVKGGARAEQAAQSVAQVLHDFLHEDASTQSQKQIFLVTIEGERTDIAPLSVEEIKKLIVAAYEGE